MEPTPQSGDDAGVGLTGPLHTSSTDTAADIDTDTDTDTAAADRSTSVLESGAPFAVQPPRAEFDAETVDTRIGGFALPDWAVTVWGQTVLGALLGGVVLLALVLIFTGDDTSSGQTASADGPSQSGDAGSSAGGGQLDESRSGDAGGLDLALPDRDGSGDGDRAEQSGSDALDTVNTGPGADNRDDTDNADTEYSDADYTGAGYAEGAPPGTDPAAPGVSRPSGYTPDQITAGPAPGAVTGPGGGTSGSTGSPPTTGLRPGTSGRPASTGSTTRSTAGSTASTSPATSPTTVRSTTTQAPVVTPAPTTSTPATAPPSGALIVSPGSGATVSLDSNPTFRGHSASGTFCWSITQAGSSTDLGCSTSSSITVDNDIPDIGPATVRLSFRSTAGASEAASVPVIFTTSRLIINPRDGARVQAKRQIKVNATGSVAVDAWCFRLRQGSISSGYECSSRATHTFATDTGDLAALTNGPATIDVYVTTDGRRWLDDTSSVTLAGL